MNYFRVNEPKAQLQIDLPNRNVPLRIAAHDENSSVVLEVFRGVELMEHNGRDVLQITLAELMSLFQKNGYIKGQEFPKLVLSDREQKEITLANYYVDRLNHGTSGHLAYNIIAKLHDYIKHNCPGAADLPYFHGDDEDDD